MKRNLLKGIVLISVIALSSCSTPNKLAGTKNADDDVYYTKAEAGDEHVFADNYDQNYNRDDDYYYYGDYASRINRFSYYSPFDYSDDFYFSYSPYNNLNLGLGYNYSSPYNYGYSPAFASPYGFGAIYSPFDYGYLPYYDLGGYDDIGYGGIYSAYLYGGGHRHRGRQRSRPGYSGGKLIANSNSPQTFHPGRVGTTNSTQRNVYYPGRPANSSNARNANATRMVRPDRDNQPAIQNVNRAPSPAPSNSGSSGNSSSGGGGGGRPVRP